MIKDVNIKDKTITLLANGSTPYRYKQVFHKDIIKLISSGDRETIVGETAPELAFIMNVQALEAAKKKAPVYSMEGFITWLEQFDPLDIPEAADEILDVYIGNSAPSEKPKKKVEAQKEK